MEALKLTKGKKTALVLGATGLVGSKLMNELLQNDAYAHIKTIGRRKTEHKGEKVSHISVDFTRLESQDERIKGHDLFIAFGTTLSTAGSKEKFKEIDYDYPLKIIQSAYANAVQQVILVSAVGASEDALFFYSRVKGVLEKALQSFNFWGIHIFRPSLLLGERNENRFGENIAQVLGRGLNFITGGLVYKYKPVEAEYLARAMVNAAQKMDGGGVHIYPSSRIYEMAEDYELQLKKRK